MIGLLVVVTLAALLAGWGLAYVAERWCRADGRLDDMLSLAAMLCLLAALAGAFGILLLLAQAALRGIAEHL